MKRTLSLLTTLVMLTPVCLPAQNRHSVVITEIMADPTPSAGLPAYEWIEIKNISSTVINLQQWRLADAGGQSGVFPSFLLMPDSMAIVCGNTAAPLMAPYGQVIAIGSFPSLANEGDIISLKSATGSLIHSVSYSQNWYNNALKKEGGWSLEMRDTGWPCGGVANWTASENPAGGTPGKKNSVNGIVTDTSGPRLLRTYSSDSLNITLVFNETIDSLSASDKSAYTISDGMVIQSVLPVGPLFQEVKISLSTPLQKRRVHQVTVSGIRDCRGNQVREGSPVKAGLAEEAGWGDIIVNEILFNPLPAGTDYVEIYNRSQKVLDAGRLFLANRSSSLLLSNTKQISQVPWFIFPGEYTVITETDGQLAAFYTVKDSNRILTVSSLPSYPDASGYVILLNTAGVIVEEVPYRDDWHFRLLGNTEGVSLERISPDGLSPDPRNWHSAASTAGYGTPGYENSQYRGWQEPAGKIETDPPVFSPDNDGRDDLARIRYSFIQQGYMATLTVFDTGGRPVRQLVRNELAGLQGSWYWDGLDDRGRPLPPGPYILLAEFFHAEGKTERHKKVLVLAGKR